MEKSLQDFNEFRERMNAKILASENLEIKRFFALDKNAYKEGALPSETKELLGLTASLVLRCNDCVTYHLKRCVEMGVTYPQLYEAFNVALVVGGSIVIPSLRLAFARIEELRGEKP